MRHMRQSWETMTSVSAGHIILTPTQPIGSGRPQRESNPGPPDQESRALPTELPSFLLVRSLNSKTYRLSNLLDKSAKLCMNDIYGIYFKSVRGAHENTAYFIFYEFLKNHFDHNEKFLGWVYIKSSPDGSELPCF